MGFFWISDTLSAVIPHLHITVLYQAGDIAGKYATAVGQPLQVLAMHEMSGCEWDNGLGYGKGRASEQDWCILTRRVNLGIGAAQCCDLGAYLVVKRMQ